MLRSPRLAGKSRRPAKTTATNLECPIVEMTLSSLRTFLRVRLYTAISRTIDIVDTTEMLSVSVIRENRSVAALIGSLELAQIPLQRLPGSVPTRYQSAIALKLAAKTQSDPVPLAQQICAAYDTSLTFPPPITLETNATGWLTLSMPFTDLLDFLDHTLCPVDSPPNLADLPFPIRHTYMRCESLRSHLLPRLSRTAEIVNSTVNPPVEMAWISVRENLIESLLDWMDAQDCARPSTRASLLPLCDAFDRLHRQVPLFHPATSPETQQAFLQCLTWVQRAIEHQSRRT
jgi:hypothetical protein